MKKLFIVLFGLFAVLMISTSALACEMHFHLISSDGTKLEIFPAKSVRLSQGETYTIEVQFIEDHNRCETSPEETVYLLEEEKWKESKDYLPLRLIERSEWIMSSSHTWIQEITFNALEKGVFELEIVRDCPKGGYDETITFKVK